MRCQCCGAIPSKTAASLRSTSTFNKSITSIECWSMISESLRNLQRMRRDWARSDARLDALCIARNFPPRFPSPRCMIAASIPWSRLPYRQNDQIVMWIGDSRQYLPPLLCHRVHRVRDSRTESAEPHSGIRSTPRSGTGSIANICAAGCNKRRKKREHSDVGANVDDYRRPWSERQTTDQLDLFFKNL